jgi:hypothetical protein
MQPDIHGSHQWQAALFLIATAWIFVSFARGWKKGLMRELAGIAGLFAAGFLIISFTGRMAEFLRPQVPSFILVPLSAALIWILSFNAVVLIGHLLFKRTAGYESSLLRLISGVGGGVIGLCYGLLFIWCVAIGVKVIGRLAANQVEIQRGKNESSGLFMVNMARVRNSMELGYGKALLNSVDPFPRSFYRGLDQYSQIIEDPEAFERLLAYPGFHRIWQSPRIQELQRDPEIIAEVRNGNVIGVLVNPKVVMLLEDPEIRNAITQSDMEAALSYALTSRGTGEQNNR